MHNQNRRAWWIFAVCTTVGVLLLAWITAIVLRLEAAQFAAQERADNEGVIRLALWRMDSWLAPQLAREAARPHFEYEPFYPQEKAYNRIFSELAPGEVWTPSPLLTFRSQLFPLHFEVDDQGSVTSPQVPVGNQRDLFEGNWTRIDLSPHAKLLQRIGDSLEPQKLSACVLRAEASIPPLNGVPTMVKQNDYQSRQAVSNLSQQATPAVGPNKASPGPFVPAWLGGPRPAEQRLVFVRRAMRGNRRVFQGFLTDWPRLSGELLAQVADLLPANASLVREDDPTVERQDRMLTSVPARLVADLPVQAPPRWTTTRTVLLGSWLALVVATLVIAFTLRSAISLAQRRARFASAVTHELRTPLTTFRMYSEMLADDMVQDDKQRARYLTTLQRESDRLSRLVENVLCWSRLEDGRYRGNRHRVSVTALLERVVPALEQRVGDARCTLVITPAETACELETDIDAIDQILFNLVDNACKYAPNGPIELSIATIGEAIEFAVRDHGPGVAPAHAEEVFRPFERGDRSIGENITPGVGLGLALARGLAFDLGGTLELDRQVEDGARFVLRIPRSLDSRNSIRQDD